MCCQINEINSKHEIIKGEFEGRHNEGFCEENEGRGLARNEAEVAAGGETGRPFICAVGVCIC